MQNLNSIETDIEKLMTSRPTRSLSGIFKAIRRLRKISLAGDYLLLNKILSYGFLREKKYLWNRKQIMRAIRISSLAEDEGRNWMPLPIEWEKYAKK